MGQPGFLQSALESCRLLPLLVAACLGSIADLRFGPILNHSFVAPAKLGTVVLRWLSDQDVKSPFLALDELPGLWFREREQHSQCSRRGGKADRDPVSPQLSTKPFASVCLSLDCPSFGFQGTGPKKNQARSHHFPFCLNHINRSVTATALSAILVFPVLVCWKTVRPRNKEAKHFLSLSCDGWNAEGAEGVTSPGTVGSLPCWVSATTRGLLALQWLQPCLA